MPAGGRKRHDADPDIGFDHPAGGFKVADLNTNLDLLVQFIGSLRQKAVDRAGFEHADKVMGQRLAEFDALAPGQLMRLRCNQHQTVFAERDDFQALGTDIACNDTDFDLAF